MNDKDTKSIKKTLVKYDRDRRIYTDYNEGYLNVYALSKKYKLSVNTIYQVLKNYKETESLQLSKVFDKEFLKGSSIDRLRTYKKQLMDIMKKLQKDERYSLLLKFYKELRSFEALELKVEGVADDDRGGGGATVVVLQNIRNIDKEMKTVEVK